MRLNLQVKEYYGIVRKGLGLSSRKNDAFFAISFFALIFLAPQVIPVTSKADFDMLKSRMASTKAEIRREGGGISTSQSPDSSPSSKVCLPFPFPFPHLHPFCPKQGHFLSFVISSLKPLCLRLIDFSWIEHLLSSQRRRMQSASKVVEKMKKRLAEQVTWLKRFTRVKVLTFMRP